MHRCSDKISKSRSKWLQLRDKLFQLAEKERSSCPTRQCFKDIAILRRNSAILNHESVTTRVNLRVQWESKKLYEVKEKRMGLVKDKMDGVIVWHSLTVCGVLSLVVSYIVPSEYVRSPLAVHFLSFLSLEHRYLINVRNRFVLVSTELSPGNTDYSWSQKCSIWAFFVLSKDRVETWYMQFCRAHRTLSTRAWTDPVDQFLWRRIIWNSIRDILEIASVVTVRSWLSSIRARFGAEPDPPSYVELNGLQSDARVLVEVPCWPGHLVEILKKGRNRKRRSARVLWPFRFHSEIYSWSHTSSFVEQIKLCRMVYDFIGPVLKLCKKTPREQEVCFLVVFVSFFMGISDHLTFADQW